MLSTRLRSLTTLLLAFSVAALVTGCAALQVTIPATRIASITGYGTTDVPAADGQRLAHADCEATLDRIPLVEVTSGTPTLAATYAVTGPELDRYLSDQARRAGVELGSTGWANGRSATVSMCLFDGDFLRNTPGPPGHDRSAVRMLVVVADGKARLWSMAKEKSALPTKDPGVTDR